MKKTLSLKATANHWRLFVVRKADPAFHAFEQKLLERDGHTCQWCGFCSEQSLGLVNLDGNLLNNKAPNLAAACPFCLQCGFLEAVGEGDFGGGSLIYLPNMSQVELNALCHALFLSMFNCTELERQASSMYKSLRLQSQVVEKTLGEGFSNPAILGKMMIEAESSQNKDLGSDFLTGVRLLPTYKRFTKDIKSWSLEAVSQMAR